MPPSPAAVQFHFLGQVEFEICLALQRRLVYEAGNGANAAPAVLLCEHPDVITIGRSGSRAHIRLSPQELERRRLQIHYVGRGGGCLLHTPGQLAIYPVIPLAKNGWTIGETMRRFQSGLASTMHELRVLTNQKPERFGLWGRSGLVCAMGVAVQSQIAWQGAFLNVSPTSSAMGYVDADAEAARSGGKAAMGSLVSETGRRVTMPMARSAVVPFLAAAWDYERYHLHTGHPLLAAVADYVRPPSVRAG